MSWRVLMDCCRHRFIDWIYLCFPFFPSVLDLSTFYFFSDDLTPSPPELSFTYTAPSTFNPHPSIHLRGSGLRLLQEQSLVLARCHRSPSTSSSDLTVSPQPAGFYFPCLLATPGGSSVICEFSLPRFMQSNRPA